MYNAKDWYWVTKESDEIYSSKQGDFIEEGNADYLAWLNSGNSPTPIPESGLIKLRIQWLEESINTRRLREAALGTDNGWMENIDSQIQALRDQL